MNKKDFFDYHRDFCETLLKISQQKNADYTGKSTDTFANFTVVEKVGVATTEQGFLTRMMDKIQRINSYCQCGTLAVEDEKVEDTLMDLANYCILFSAYLRSKKDDKGNTISEEPSTDVGNWWVDSEGFICS